MLLALATCGAAGGGGFLAAGGGFGGRAVDVTADWNVFFTAVTALICLFDANGDVFFKRDISVYTGESPMS